MRVPTLDAIGGILIRAIILLVALAALSLPTAGATECVPTTTDTLVF